MTQKQRIEELEAKIAALEARLVAQEAKPVYYQYFVPYQPSTTAYPWTVAWKSAVDPPPASGTI